MKFSEDVEVGTVKNRNDAPANEGEVGAPGFYVPVSNKEIPIHRLTGIFSSQGSFERLLGSLYRESGELDTLDLGGSDLNVVGTGLKVTIKTTFGAPMVFKGGEMDQIRVEPIANKLARFSARLKLSKPTDEQMAAVLKAQHQGVTLTVSGRTEVPEEDEEQDEQSNPNHKLPLESRNGAAEDEERAH